MEKAMPAHVTVEGEDTMVREAITNVIYEALHAKGFVNTVAMTSSWTPTTYQSSDSILEMVAQHAPHLFGTRIQLQGSFAHVKEREPEGPRPRPANEEDDFLVEILDAQDKVRSTWFIDAITAGQIEDLILDTPPGQRALQESQAEK